MNIENRFGLKLDYLCMQCTVHMKYFSLIILFYFLQLIAGVNNF